MSDDLKSQVSRLEERVKALEDAFAEATGGLQKRDPLRAAAEELMARSRAREVQAQRGRGDR